MPGVGLHMIVKNEAHVLERSLRSLSPLIDWWVISDTGSTDGTQDLIRTLMADKPGLLIERPWVNFGHNRQEALDAARTLPAAGAEDYVLWFDADDEMVDHPEAWPELTLDGYTLPVRYDHLHYRRIGLIRLHAAWEWRGALHEALHLDGASIGNLERPLTQVHHEGARSQDPDTYQRDAEVLEAEYRRDPQDPRTQFYLAQSWRDAGDLERSLELYRIRAANHQGWDQEQWYAGFEAVRVQERIGADPQVLVDGYLGAWARRPDRAEPLVEAARIERGRERYALAALYARQATQLEVPSPDTLFLDPSAYGWRAWDELAVAGYWSGARVEGRAAAVRALELNPGEPRLIENLAWFDR
jgi:hypothetical protein